MIVPKKEKSEVDLGPYLAEIAALKAKLEDEKRKLEEEKKRFEDMEGRMLIKVNLESRRFYCTQFYWEKI